MPDSSERTLDAPASPVATPQSGEKRTGPDPWRRHDITRMEPAELAIRDAMLAVEHVGANVLLTEAVNHLSKAAAALADYIDGVNVNLCIHGCGSPLRCGHPDCVGAR